MTFFSQTRLVILNSRPMLPAYFCHVPFMKISTSCLLNSMLFLSYEINFWNYDFFSQARRTCGTTHFIRPCTILHATGFGLPPNFEDCDIKSEFSYILCSYLRRLVIQDSLKCTETLQIFFNPLTSKDCNYYLSDLKSECNNGTKLL
jgi:hypothetical protein